MKRISYILLTLLLLLPAACADYDDTMDVVKINIKLKIPETYDGPLDGLRVELLNTTASTFVDSTDTQGEAHFTVPAGIYSVRSSAQKTTKDYRYFFNGTLSQVIVTSDSAHTFTLPLTMSRKRIVH